MSEKKKVKVKLTMEEGQTLLRFASSFGLPEKLGDGSPFNVAERALAAKDVQLLYRELKSRSPLLIKDRRLCFGPEDAWEKDGGNGNEVWKMTDHTATIEVTLSEDTLSGVYWCLVLALHPASSIVLNAGNQEEMAWPLAEKLKIVKALEKAVSLKDAQHKRLDFDDDASTQEAPVEMKKEG